MTSEDSTELEFARIAASQTTVAMSTERQMRPTCTLTQARITFYWCDHLVHGVRLRKSLYAGRLNIGEVRQDSATGKYGPFRALLFARTDNNEVGWYNTEAEASKALVDAAIVAFTERPGAPSEPPRTSWRSQSVIGEKCRICQKPAAAKVGEEIMSDDPNPHRHNMTAYLCEFHFIQVMGPAAIGILAR